MGATIVGAGAHSNNQLATKGGFAPPKDGDTGRTAALGGYICRKRCR
jgi:hypothetical protein